MLVCKYFRHILLLDFLTWDLSIRMIEFENISRYVMSVIEMPNVVNASKSSAWLDSKNFPN